MILARLWVTLAAAPLLGHTISFSRSQMDIADGIASLTVTMPASELMHIAPANRDLTRAFRIGGAQLLRSECLTPGDHVCRSLWKVPQTVETLTVECSLAAISVASHVHILEATMGAKRGRAVFDAAFTRATVRFETGNGWTQALAAGAWRAFAGWLPLAFVVALAFTPQPLWAGLGLVAGVLLIRVPLSPVFADWALGIAAAYLVVETVFFRDAPARWLTTLAAGACAAIAPAVFAGATQYPRVAVGAGTAIAACGAAFLLKFIAKRAGRRS